MARNDGSDSDHSGGGHSGGGKKGKARRELPAGAVATLKAWLLSPEHFTHPYPTPQDQVLLMQQTGIDKKQLKNWFTNARRRIWKPMIKKQLEQGKIAATGTETGGMAVSGVVPGVMVPPAGGASAPTGENVDTHSAQAIQTHYQQAVQTQQYDAYGNPVYQQQTTEANHPGAPQYYQQQYGQQDGAPAPAPMASSGSIGSLPPMGGYSSQGSSNMAKNDSHAVLMELFARDQDLVRQAAESARMKAAAKGEQQTVPSKIGSSSKLAGVPSMNSWPHFSSISSLNNLGQMTGVKSIASLSGADLASQGNLNKMGNLAQVKSMESMGKNDSYAFLEVFFGDRGMSSTNLSAKQQDSGGGRGIKREREEDNDVGLSLDADESPSTATVKQTVDSDAPRRAAGAPVPAPLPAPGNEGVIPPQSGTLKRAYDDALAARGLMSVSRSCEKLSDLALPAKMQRTLSQEYLRQHQQKQQQVQAPQYGQYNPPPPPVTAPAPAKQPSEPVSQQYPGQHPGQNPPAPPSGPSSALSDPTSVNSSVEVSSATKCALCQKTDVDTQLRPCGHMFHERCLKPSLQTPMGQPRCPIDQMPMESALLAVPTDENTAQPTPQPQRAWNEPASAFQTANTPSS